VRNLRELCRIAGVIAAAGLVSAAAANPGTGTTPDQPGKPVVRPVTEPGKGVRGVPTNDLCSGAITLATNGIFIVDQTDATDTGDVGYSCHNGGAGTLGFANIWYKFVATATTMRLQTCDTIVVGDSLLAVYDVDELDPCNTLVEIACSDDACGSTEFQSLIDITTLVVGQTYYIQIGAWTPADIGPYTLQLQSPIPAATVPCPPGAQQEGEADCISGNPGCAGQGGGPNPNLNTPITLPAVVCGTGRLDSITPLVRDNDYYGFNIPSESSITITVQSEFNVQVALVNGGGTFSCPNPFAFRESMNAVAGQLGTFTVCVPAGDWLILVRSNGTGVPFGCAAALQYVLTVTNTGACPSCPVTPPPGADFEGEIAASGDCGGWITAVDLFNGGCNSAPPVFSQIECGQTIYGSAASTGARRDTDWYDITFKEETEVTYTGQTENYELVIGIIQANPDTGDCPSTGFLIAGVVPNCTSGFITTTLAPGRYFFFAGADFTPAVNCPGDEANPNYAITLVCGGGKITDCNENGIDDAADIAAGTSKDCFDFAAAAGTAGGPNGIPDECECVADWNRDGTSNSTDVSDFINTFFADQAGGGSDGDVNCDGVSNSTDVSDFINVWFAAQAGQLPFAGCTI